ncbi:hypothetical protein O5O45_11565 [Hahella aquimaris]|uniref:hypothetical protein n=1 Tax=Hahella sp. HNIBRBA332 TaxID=3015983 RepID=UPI00273B4487|nr:hypothetical protein [Hahella sp. HNIBRBA332]WLQ16558.1 hypothetical protein O5O45_11565 [Hahella sp. HNIBRBA332]
MAKDNHYETVLVESYIPHDLSGKHGKVHIRPVSGGKYPVTLNVECSKKLSRNYPVGTKFKLQAKLTDREGGGEFLYSYHGWKYEVVS